MIDRHTPPIPETFPTLPGLDALDAVTVQLGDGAAEAVGWVLGADDAVPAELGLSRDALESAGFTGAAGSVLVIPTAEGDRIAVGAEAGLDGLRDAAAAFVRAAARRSRLRLVVDRGDVDPRAAVAALTEGALLARYAYTPFRTESTHVPLDTLLLDVAGDAAGIADALLTTRATVVARDLANTPPEHLTATNFGDIAAVLGARFGFDVELFDRAALTELGCGGLLGVNRGSVQEPRMVRLSYTPAGTPTGHLGLVGKGIMYDSGGISLKPSDPMHLLMKMDMGGAAAVLGAFTALADSGSTARVTGWLMCTDNMPSATAYKLGDVLTARGGTTIEVKNTDAEGRLVMSDALVLANEAEVDAIIDIATLTGAALMALGQLTAPVFGNDDALVGRVQDAAAATGEQLWRLPLERRYRSQLDSDIADISNLGGKYAGATTAALFLEHFAGSTPWAHLDIAGTMQSDTDDSWRTRGATGFGARTLLGAARDFTAPAS